MVYDTNPIGVFDSGVGGLSVLKEIISLLPEESVIYFADSKNCPYGSKPAGDIITLMKKHVDFLIARGCKLIVVACNTATAAAIEILRKEYTIPFVGMEPAIKPAAVHSKNGKIGILATEGTFNGKLYKSTSKKYANHMDINDLAGYGLVELVESGLYHSQEAADLLRRYIEPMIKNNVDQIVLGCTHYPFLMDTIRKITGNKIRIVDPSAAVAKQVLNLLIHHNLSSKPDDNINPAYKFYTSGKKNTAEKMIRFITDKPFEFYEINRI